MRTSRLIYRKAPSSLYCMLGFVRNTIDACHGLKQVGLIGIFYVSWYYVSSKRSIRRVDLPHQDILIASMGILLGKGRT